MAIQHQLTPATLIEAHEMALKGHLWNRGQSKVNGREFYIIPSRSEPKVAHWAGLAGSGCTCKGYRRHGDCAHAEAVRVFEARKAEEVVPLKDFRDIWPGCASGCGDLVERQNQSCWLCTQKREREQRQASQRAAMAAGGR